MRSTEPPATLSVAQRSLLMILSPCASYKTSEAGALRCWDRRFAFAMHGQGRPIRPGVAIDAGAAARYSGAA